MISIAMLMRALLGGPHVFLAAPVVKCVSNPIRNP